MQVPFQMANDTIKLTIVDQQELDRYGKPKVVFDSEIKNCVVNMQTVYSGTNSNRQLVANGLIILYKGCSTPLPVLDKDKLGSKVTYRDKTYTVTSIDEYDQPGSDELYSYELQVI